MIPDEEISRNAKESRAKEARIPKQMRSDSNAGLLLPEDAIFAIPRSATLHSSWSQAVYACAKEPVASSCVRLDGGRLTILTRDELGTSQKTLDAFSLCEVRTCLRDIAASRTLHLASSDQAQITRICAEAKIDLAIADPVRDLPGSVDFDPVKIEDDQVRMDFLVLEKKEFGRTLHGGQFIRIGMNRKTGRVDIFKLDTGERIGDGGHFEAIIKSEQSRHGLSSEEISEMDGYVGEVECSVRGKDGSGRMVRHSYLNMPKRFEQTISRLGRPSLDFFAT